YAFVLLNDTSSTALYSLALHDALPIYRHDFPVLIDKNQIKRHRGVLHPERQPSRLFKNEQHAVVVVHVIAEHQSRRALEIGSCQDRKSTRLNSSHVKISYAVFCSKKKI